MGRIVILWAALEDAQHSPTKVSMRTAGHAHVLEYLDESETRDYATGVGRVAILSAALEDALHRAIVSRLGHPRIEVVLRDLGSMALLRAFCVLHDDAPEVTAFEKRVSSLLRNRNTVVHGVELLDLDALFTEARKIRNRKRGTEEHLPSLDELNALITGLREALHETWFFEETRDFGYSREVLEEAVQRHFETQAMDNR